MNITASDKSALIRLAASLPKGENEDLAWHWTGSEWEAE